MRDFKLEIEQAKKEIIASKMAPLIKEWEYKKSKGEIVSKPEQVEVKAWFITQWGTGFIVCDYEELRKLPKTKRNKILSLGGLK